MKLNKEQMEEAIVFLPDDVRAASENKDFKHVHVIGRCGYGQRNGPFEDYNYSGSDSF